MKIIGITGGTGVGKTTVLNYLQSLGAYVIDCDEVYHQLLANNKAMTGELDAAFPGVVVDGTLDRKALGAVVFSDEAALARLNGITHRYVNDQVEAQLKRELESGRKICAIDAIALLEGGIKDRCDFTVGVIAPTELRIKRLMAREGITEQYAKMRISAQKPNEYFIQNCDYILDNSADGIENFVTKCSSLFNSLLEV